jgi:hypothetical protein
MLTDRDLHALLCRKLDFQSEEGGCHKRYKLCSESRVIRIPTFIVVPRHRGDISRTVAKSTASALGLNMKRLETSARCSISARCIYICLAAKVIGVGLETYNQDPPTHQHLLPAIDGTVTTLLDYVGNNPPSWNQEELPAVEAAKELYINPVASNCGTLKVFPRWQTLAGQI